MSLSDAPMCDLFRRFARRDWIDMFPQAYAPLVGDYICPHVASVAVSTGINLNNNLRASLFFIQRRMRFDQIGLYVITAGAAGAEVRLGVYNLETNYYPTSLILDAGTVGCTTTGNKTVAINLTLNRGWYGLVFNCNDATIGIYYNSVTVNPLASTSAFPYSGCSWAFAQAYGALPATYPAGGYRIGAKYMTLRVAELL